MATIEKRESECKITYRVKVRLKGYPSQTASFDRLTDARKWAQDTESDLRNRRHFKSSEAKNYMLAEAIDRYITHVLPTKPKSRYLQTIHLNWWRAQIGQYSMADITPVLIAKCRDKLATEITIGNKVRAPATVNRYMAALSHMFTIAMKEWGLVDENPLRKVSKKKEPRGRVRFLSDDERSRLLESCKQAKRTNLYMIVVLALSTGARKNELMSLTWESVDIARGVITLHETKNGDRRLLALAGHALELVKKHAQVRHLNCNLLFPSKDLKKPLDIRTPFENACKKAELPDFKFHDLRHSAASYLAMNGASLAEIAEVLGHKTLQMVKRYAHLSDAHTMSVVSRMNAQIFGG